MFELKAISSAAISEALGRVERYRLLNEPVLAESICRDVLQADPGNGQARIDLILSLSDQFPDGLTKFREARGLAAGIDDEYERNYYSGIVRERRAHAHFQRRTPGFGGLVYNLLREAMEFYEVAEELRPPGNPDTILRWNTCARIINDHDHVEPERDTVAPIELE